MTHVTSPCPSACEPTGGQRTLLPLGVTLVAGALPVLLTVTMVTVAVEPIAVHYAVSAGVVHWVATAYLLAITAVIPTLGWLVGRYGTRRVWFGALWLFLAGSLACAAAWSLGSLIVFRVAQGLGGGLILPLLQTVLAQRAGPGGFARAMALVAVPGQLVPIIGPLVGGLLVDGPGWRWIFLLSGPLTVGALLLARSGLPPDPATTPAAPLDVIGLLLAIPGLVVALYALSTIGQRGQLTGPGGWWLAIGGLLLAAYVVWGQGVGRPVLVDLELLRHQPVGAATAVTFMLGVCLWGSLFLLPLYLQQARGAGGTEAGLLLAPQGLGTLVGLLAVGWLVARAGSRRAAVAGLTLAMVATVPFAMAAAYPSDAVLASALFLRGLGLGIAGVPALGAAYARLHQNAAPAATTLLSIAQRLGAAIGTAVLAIVLDHLLLRGIEPVVAYGWTFTWSVLLTAVAAVLATRLPARVTA